MERLLGLYTPGKLAAARRALSGDARPAPDERPRTRCQMHALPETLTLVCETPFASVDDLSHLKRVPASTLRGLGLAEVHPHRLAMLSDRPLWRHVPTPAGIAALGGDDLLYSHPVSRQWLRLLAERLNGVALIYEMAALIAGADPKQDPVRVEYCCSGPYDALVTLSGGRTLGIVAGRPGGTRGGAPRVRGAAEATPGMAFRRRRAGDAAQRRRCVRGRARAHGRGSERPRAP